MAWISRFAPTATCCPNRVTEDLPRAVETLRKHGLTVPMITTDITSATDPAAIPTLRAAPQLGIPYFKPGYWRYARPGRTAGEKHRRGDAPSGHACRRT